jgi:transcriptional regulator with XRE-family HTH domain
MRGRRVMNLAHAMSHRYSNNLKSHRKRSGFTQEELAFLLGLKEHSAISRFEHGEREPGLRTALAYRMLFHRDLHELFPHVHEEVSAQIGKRAERLSKDLGCGAETPKSTYKLAKLAALQRGAGAQLQAV